MSPNNVSRKEKILLGTVHNLKDKVSALSLENAELRAHIHVLKSELQDSQHQTEEFRSIVEGSVEGVVPSKSEKEKLLLMVDLLYFLIMEGLLVDVVESCQKGGLPMRGFEFRRIAFDDWEQTATGTIDAKGNYLEINTDNENLMKFLCRCRTSGEVITNPVVWIGNGYEVYVGAYKVILMDDEGIVLRKTKK